MALVGVNTIVTCFPTRPSLVSRKHPTVVLLWRPRWCGKGVWRGGYMIVGGLWLVKYCAGKHFAVTLGSVRVRAGAHGFFWWTGWPDGRVLFREDAHTRVSFFCAGVVCCAFRRGTGGGKGGKGGSEWSNSKHLYETGCSSHRRQAHIPSVRFCSVNRARKVLSSILTLDPPRHPFLPHPLPLSAIVFIFLQPPPGFDPCSGRFTPPAAPRAPGESLASWT